MKLHVNSGHAPAQPQKRVLVDTYEENMHLISCLGEVLDQCEACRAPDKAPHAPVAGTSTVAMFHGKIQVGLLFSGDIILCMLWAFSLSTPF